MMVPLLPVGGPLPGEMDDFSIIRPEKHLWVSVWAYVLLCAIVWLVHFF